MKDTKVKRHPVFAAAVNLELMENQDGLVFEREYHLNKNPL